MPSVKTHLFDSYFLHLKGSVGVKSQPSTTALSTLSVFFAGKMAMISWFIFLCMLQAAIPQGLTPHGPRPIPGRGDSPDPTAPPLPPRPKGCKSEFHQIIKRSVNMIISSVF